MKSFVGHIINKAIKRTARSKKISPTIKSVKPNLKKTGKQTRSDEYRKRYIYDFNESCRATEKI